jgi:hypothetical protein
MIFKKSKMKSLLHNKSLIPLMIAFILFSFKSYSQISMPFRLCDNRILVEYEIFDTVLSLGFDTAASFNLVNKSSLPDHIVTGDGYNIFLGLYGAEMADINTNSKSIFGSEWRALKVKSHDSGCKIDGILSVKILHGKILEIDFRNERLHFFDTLDYKPDPLAHVLDVAPAWADQERASAGP